MTRGYFRQIFEKYPRINFINSPSSGSRNVPCGRTDGRRHRQKEDIQTWRR